MKARGKGGFGYPAVFALSFILALMAGWLAVPIDNWAYDWLLRRHRPAPHRLESVLLAVDETSLAALGGMRGLRGAVAEALDAVAAAGPKGVAFDIIVAEGGEPSQDAALEAAFARLPGLVLPCELIDQGRAWEMPLPRFARHAAAIGHVHGQPGPFDGVSRMAPLEQATERDRRWALALEAFRLSRGTEITESPEDLRVGPLRVPAGRADSRLLRIRYVPPNEDGSDALPRITLKQLRDQPSLAKEFTGKVVFVGLTAQSAFRDRMLTPYSSGEYMPGVEIHAHIFETLARGQFLVPASEGAGLLATLLLAAAGVLAFALRSGWQAYALGGLVLLAAHLVPGTLFTRGVVFPYVAPISAAWLSVVGAGAWQFFGVRRQLREAQADRSRYQQAMHFVTHEMKTPLTAIQGSSELMTRFNLSEDKRKQIATMINAESKRLARMIETFLNVERLSAGQMELNRAPFPLRQIMEPCLERARALADRKQIRIAPEELPEAMLEGDRELMEYAIYNLLNNAVKYSPAGTEVVVRGRLEGGTLRLAVQDQGIGMEQDEIRKIFDKFYRTRRALASGEAGTGIGLSIVDQIVTHHGGRIEVTSAPGRGSCFTVVLPARGALRPAEAGQVAG